MELKLNRIYLGDTYTIGKLFIDGKYFCDTIEDKVRNFTIEEKIYGKTSIPYGKYEIKVTLSNHFKRYLPILLNVPYFEGIRIHAGNTEFDTEGCILLGENKIKGKVINSKKYVDELTELLLSKQKINERNFIEII